MEQIVQVTALCVVGALLAVVVRRGSPECALVLGIAAAVGGSGRYLSSIVI